METQMNKNPNILWNTIYNKLIKHINKFEIDIRYLKKWMKLYPTYFPKFMLKNNYKIIFNSEKLRWEIYKI
jgi:hypothetical protein